MDVTYEYVLAAALGGLIGGLGHALISDSLAAPKRDPITGDFNFGWIKNVFVGLFSGLVWLLPNQNTWADATKAAPKDLILIALQTLIIGLAGAGWLTSYLQTKGLQGAVAKAAASQQDVHVAGQIAGAKTVKDVLTLVSQLKP